jgi:superfamily II DNA or RNA helicase
MPGLLAFCNGFTALGYLKKLAPHPEILYKPCSMDTIAKSNWTRHFDSATFQRGRHYVNTDRVLSYSMHRHSDQLTIDGLVKGSTIYRVQINIDASRGDVVTACTCPMRRKCKHAVAVILESKAMGPNSEVNHPTLNEGLDNSLRNWLGRLEDTLNLEKKSTKTRNELLVFTLDQHDSNSTVLEVETGLSRVLKKGGLGKPQPFYPSSETKRNKLTMQELEAFSLLDALGESHYRYDHHYRFNAKNAYQIIKKLLPTQQCYWQDMANPHLSEGDIIYAEVAWEMQLTGLQKLKFNLPSADLLILYLDPLCYLNTKTGQFGVIQSNFPEQYLNHLAKLPPLPPKQANTFVEQLNELCPTIPIPRPRQFLVIEEREIPLEPHLYICEEELVLKEETSKYMYSTIRKPFFLAIPILYYEGCPVNGAKSHAFFTVAKENILIQGARDSQKEQGFMESLEAKHQFIPISKVDNMDGYLALRKYDVKEIFLLPSEEIEDDLTHFMTKIVPQLKNEGWVIDYDPALQMDNFVAVDSWYTDLNESSDNGWFDLELGVVVNGERINLFPHLIEAIKSSKTLKSRNDQFILKVPELGNLPIPIERLDRIMQVISELFGSGKIGKNGALKISNYQASLLIEMQKAFQANELRWFGDHRLKDLSEKISNFTKLKNVPVPKVFQATLRPYQKAAVNWLQFLREFNLAGILADDMGLGKTVQTLAHLSIEKKEKRLTHPCLIIAPTSVVHNWQAEIQKFSPHLKTLVLQGADRKEKFDSVAEQDIILTTYPLLIHDTEFLLNNEYYYLILDEAQLIKNSQAKMTQIVQQIKAKHRLCLTGTPLENHLGELWSLFHFLAPGLLGNKRQFAERYRTPIEKDRDPKVQQRLSALINPFILRRKKSEVAKDLPEKTEIIHSIELSEPQRDLYESIRLAMHEKVKKAIEQKGLERSQIVILDALLKLRQVCCDPRLLKIESAKKVVLSSKLEALMEMLEELCEEGRRILLFSQFVGMLSLIENELSMKKIPFVKITGSTKDRITPIQKFQAGEVPIFLISLKAGGTGLNLTAADTVIHYDPWWNPAVEQQATDRAHRIGQTSKVFVYKFITKNTVEEKILEMQAKKQSLVDAIFSGQSHKGKLTKKDLDSLFA